MARITCLLFLCRAFLFRKAWLFIHFFIICLILFPLFSTFLHQRRNSMYWIGCITSHTIEANTHLWLFVDTQSTVTALKCFEGAIEMTGLNVNADLWHREEQSNGSSPLLAWNQKLSFWKLNYYCISYETVTNSITACSSEKDQKSLTKAILGQNFALALLRNHWSTREKWHPWTWQVNQRIWNFTQKLFLGCRVLLCQSRLPVSLTCARVQPVKAQWVASKKSASAGKVAEQPSSVFKHTIPHQSVLWIKLALSQVHAESTLSYRQRKLKFPCYALYITLHHFASLCITLTWSPAIRGDSFYNLPNPSCHLPWFLQAEMAALQLAIDDWASGKQTLFGVDGIELLWKTANCIPKILLSIPNWKLQNWNVIKSSQNSVKASRNIWQLQIAKVYNSKTGVHVSESKQDPNPQKPGRSWAVQPSSRHGTN